MKIFFFAAMLAVASAGRFANRATELTISDPQEYEQLQQFAKPEVKNVELCDNGEDVRNEDFTPTGNCYFLVEEECDPAKHGMFWFSEKHSSVYSKCQWVPPSIVAPGYCEFNPINYCKYTWEEEEYDLLRQVEKLLLRNLHDDMTQECQRGCYQDDGPCMHEGEGDSICVDKVASEGGSMICPHGFYDCSSLPTIPGYRNFTSFRKFIEPGNMAVECQKPCDSGVGSCMHAGEGDITCRERTVMTEAGSMVCTRGYVDCASAEMQEAIQTYNDEQAYIQSVIDSRTALRRRHDDMTQECQRGCFHADLPCMHEGYGDSICAPIITTGGGSKVCPPGFYDCSSLPPIPGYRNFTL